MKYMLFLIGFLFSATSIQAGGGRMLLYSNSTATYHQKKAPITAQIFADDQQSTFSPNERIEFRVVNPIDGDHCITEQGVTDQLGVVYAYCYSNREGSIQVIAHSLDRSDDSSAYLLHFAKPVQSTPPKVETPKPSPITEKKQATTVPQASKKPIATVNPMPKATVIPSTEIKPKATTMPTAPPHSAEVTVPRTEEKTFINRFIQFFTSLFKGSR